MIQIQTRFKKILADTQTPVGLYLKLRDKFPNSLLLESAEYQKRENNCSYICCNPIAGFKVENGTLETWIKDGEKRRKPIKSALAIYDEIANFTQSFAENTKGLPYNAQSFVGYSAFDSVQYFEDIEWQPKPNSGNEIPELQYALYQFVLVFDHFNQQLCLFENSLSEQQTDELDTLEQFIQNRNFAHYQFELSGTETSNISGDTFKNMVSKGIEHCLRGDVFQLVLSRRFQQGFTGDEFNVYRILRAINPSPYLFYFDYGNFKIFGSSPEAQLQIHKGKAVINPIAGTYKRTGNDEQDAALAEALAADPKENAEHTMLVDLARNDIGKHCSNVQVEVLKQIQFFSHVIHLVSKVTGNVEDSASFKLFGDTFPAGTLSGAPKYKALQLINQYETTSRSFYGGGIGFIGLNGDINQAILIRSFLSKENTLYYQAGAGIVKDSDPQKELEEVDNKLAALRKALLEAEKI